MDGDKAVGWRGGAIRKQNFFDLSGQLILDIPSDKCKYIIYLWK